MKYNIAQHESNNYLKGFTISFIPENLTEELLLNGILHEMERNDKNSPAYLEVEIAGFLGRLKKK